MSNGPERIDDGVNVGLLPHEFRFLTRILPVAQRATVQAQQEVGEANSNSGGDWAFDDPVTQMAAQEALLKDARYKELKSLYDEAVSYPQLCYPDKSDDVVRVGSRVTIVTNKYTDILDVVTRRIPGMPEDEESETSHASLSSALGRAVLRATVGDNVKWLVGDRLFEATVVDIDQCAQKTFYDRVVQ